MSRNGYNPIVYLLTWAITGRRKGVNSSQIVKLLYEVYGERRIDGSPGAADTSVRPTPSRLPISSLSFIGFRYLFFFREPHRSPRTNALRRTYVIFSRNGNQWGLFPHIQERQRFFQERARNILIDVKIARFFSIYGMLNIAVKRHSVTKLMNSSRLMNSLLLIKC